MREVTISLDPGKDWATGLWIDGELRDVGFQEIPASAGGLAVDVLVVEFPVIRSNGDADPNTIVRLAWRGGQIAERIGARMTVEVPTVAVPKSIIRKRVRAILTEDELANLDAGLASVPEGKQHNVYDSVRHGLVHFGRMA